MPMIREPVRPDHKTEEAKYIAVVDDVAERAKGPAGGAWRGALGYLSRQFTKRRIPHNIAQLPSTTAEATTIHIAVAGRRGGVTVATNMASRGTKTCAGRQRHFSPSAAARTRPGSVETPEVRGILALRAPIVKRKPARGQEVSRPATHHAQC